MSKKKLKLVFTFGVGTEHGGKVVIVNCNNIINAIKYVFNNYGQDNVAFEYHYNKESLKNGCAYEDGLFEEVKSGYNYGEKLIKEFNYEIMEEITLEENNV